MRGVGGFKRLGFSIYFLDSLLVMRGVGGFRGFEFSFTF